MKTVSEVEAIGKCNPGVTSAAAGRRRRRDAGSVRLGRRDIVGLQWAAEQGVMRLDQLAELFASVDNRAVSTEAARKTVGRWADHGWAISRTVLQGQAPFVWLTTAGMRHAGLAYPAGEPALGTLQHTTDVTAIRLNLLLTAPDSRWRCERDIRAAIPARRRGQGVPHIPDAEVRLADGRMVAVERERTAKTVERTRTIQLGLLSRRYDYDRDTDTSTTLLEPRYALVAYYASDEAMSVVTQARDRLPRDLQSRLLITRWPA